MNDGYSEAKEDFDLLVESLNTTKHGTIWRVETTGSYIFNARDNLYWFSHVVFYDTCSATCKGHEYWGTHVGHLREFDVMEDSPPHLLGYRVVQNPHEALTGSWADGGALSV